VSSGSPVRRKVLLREHLVIVQCIWVSNIYLSVGKPSVLTGFGLVTQDNAPYFVPFNSTVAPFANATVEKQSMRARQSAGDQCFFCDKSRLANLFSQISAMV
jgi:hypothetical protein